MADRRAPDRGLLDRSSGGARVGVVVEPSRSTLSLLLLVATATVLELPPMASSQRAMACLCTGGRASGRSGACVGRPWRAPPEQPGKCARSLRVASVVGVRLGRSRTWSTGAPPAAGGAPPAGCVHIARTRLRHHDRRVAGGGLGSRVARRPVRADDDEPAARYRSAQARTYSSVHTASRVEPEGRDPSRVRARAGHAKTPPPRWRRGLTPSSHFRRQARV